MKRQIYNTLSLLLLAVLCTWGVSCSKNKELTPEPTAEEMIIGKWFFVKIIYADGTVYIPENDCEKKAYREFEANGIISQGIYTLDGTACRESVSTGSYVLVSNGKKMVVTASDGTANTSDITLDEKTLEIRAAGTIGILEKR